MKLKAPFPYFGGKSRIAALVWDRFGDPQNYVEPFAGSLAVPLARPTAPRIETVNDIDAFITNFWRAVTFDPEATAQFADYPVSELDLHARHRWLVEHGNDMREKLRADPEFFDAMIAGWWVWGASCWIGGGWCTMQDGPNRRPTSVSMGVHCKREIPSLRHHGRGLHQKNGKGRKRDHWNPMPDVSGSRGVNSKGGRPQLVHHGEGVCAASANIHEWFHALSNRLRRVRICCGDFERVLTESVTTYNGLTAVFLDPPYDPTMRDEGIYASDALEDGDKGPVHIRARNWAIANGDNPKFRIALCGYEGEHEMPESWDCVHWKAQGGYSNRSGSENRRKERIWFSPHCLKTELF